MKRFIGWSLIVFASLDYIITATESFPNYVRPTVILAWGIALLMPFRFRFSNR